MTELSSAARGGHAHRHRSIEVSYRDVGSYRTRVLELVGHGTPIVCLHGFSDHADTWRPIMRALAHTDRPVVAVDLPGFGRATPLDASRSVLTQHDEFTAALARAVAEQYERKVVLVGNSLGAAATLRAGIDHSLPVAGLVPVSPAGFDHSWAIKFAERQRDIAPILSRRGLPMPVVRNIIGAAFRTASCGRPRQADREAVRLYVEQFQTRADLLRVLGSANGVIEELRIERHWDIDVPVLLLWGDRDRLTLFRGAQRVVKLIPQTELVVLHGAGHCPQLEIAPRVATLIADFTDRVAVPR